MRPVVVSQLGPQSTSAPVASAFCQVMGPDSTSSSVVPASVDALSSSSPPPPPPNSATAAAISTTTTTIGPYRLAGFCQAGGFLEGGCPPSPFSVDSSVVDIDGSFLWAFRLRTSAGCRGTGSGDGGLVGPEIRGHHG